MRRSLQQSNTCVISQNPFHTSSAWVTVPGRVRQAANSWNCDNPLIYRVTGVGFFIGVGENIGGWGKSHSRASLVALRITSNSEYFLSSKIDWFILVQYRFHKIQGNRGWDRPEGGFHATFSCLIWFTELLKILPCNIFMPAKFKQKRKRKKNIFMPYMIHIDTYIGYRMGVKILWRSFQLTLIRFNCTNHQTFFIHKGAYHLD